MNKTYTLAHNTSHSNSWFTSLLRAFDTRGGDDDDDDGPLPPPLPPPPDFDAFAGNLNPLNPSAHAHSLSNLESRVGARISTVIATETGWKETYDTTFTSRFVGQKKITHFLLF